MYVNQLFKQFVNLYLTEIVDPNEEPDEDTFASLMYDTSKRYVSHFYSCSRSFFILIMA